MSFARFTPVIRSSRYVLRSITPAVCRIAPNRTACDMLRSYSAVGRDRHSCVLGCRVVIRLCWFTSGLRVFWRRSRRDYRGRWVTELAARPLCVFAQPHWLCRAFRGEYAGAKCGSRTAAAPQTAPKSLRLSGLSSRCGGIVLVRIRRAVARVHGKTRPSPIYARAGRAVLR